MNSSQAKKVYINGGTGFVGRALCSSVLKEPEKYNLIVQTRRPSHHRHPRIQFVHSYSELQNGSSPEVMINLSGAPIADKRWTAERRKELVNSRVRNTRELLQTIEERGDAPRVLISASAVGYYGDRQEELVTEQSAKGEGFATELCDAWEAEAHRFEALGTRVVILRMGVVIGQGGGILEKLLPIYQFGLGGKIGKGNQWVSWIHIDDLIKLMMIAIEDERYSGIYNATAPAPIRQKDFSRNLGQKTCRPTVFTTPEMVLKLVFGDMAKEVLIAGQKVIPQASQKLGFDFQYPQFDQALNNIFR